VERREFLACTRIDEQALNFWLDIGWLLPWRQNGILQFSDVDVARAQLICDLRADFGVNDEGISVVLDLIDQIHGLRRMLRTLVSALREQSGNNASGASPQPEVTRGGSAPPETGPATRASTLPLQSTRMRSGG
jgi:chaperone modulatory protein CbpM